MDELPSSNVSSVVTSVISQVMDADSEVVGSQASPSTPVNSSFVPPGPPRESRSSRTDIGRGEGGSSTCKSCPRSGQGAPSPNPGRHKRPQSVVATHPLGKCLLVDLLLFSSSFIMVVFFHPFSSGLPFGLVFWCFPPFSFFHIMPFFASFWVCVVFVVILFDWFWIFWTRWRACHCYYNHNHKRHVNINLKLMLPKKVAVLIVVIGSFVRVSSIECNIFINSAAFQGSTFVRDLDTLNIVNVALCMCSFK